VAADLRGALTAPKVKHHAALLEPQAVGALLRAIDAFDGQPATIWALQIAPHVFVRPGELRQAEWSEIDLEGAVWRIPAARMKMKREHAVPLSEQVIATLKEVKSLMPNTISLLSLDDINLLNEIDETSTTIEGNALLKAQTIYKQTGINCFADDTGLLVDALNGAPGVYSARYAGEQKNDEDNMRKLLLDLLDKETRNAHFKSVMALIIDGKEYLFEGIINGKIISEKIGTNGFGYDPIFVPNGYTETFAQLNSETKNAISHRGIALNKLINFINASVVISNTNLKED
jgi:XTP/dITP diphosphohydrolase